jgi:hypothetical protein
MRHRTTLAAAAALAVLASIGGLYPQPVHASPIIEAPVNRFIQWPHDSLPLSRVAIAEASAAVRRQLAAGADPTTAPSTVAAGADCQRRSSLRVTAC